MLFGREIEVQLVSSGLSAMGEHTHTITSANTLLVKGLNVESRNEEILDLYFSNQAKCGGSGIAEISVQDNEAYITYVDPGGIIMAHSLIENAKIMCILILNIFCSCC